MRKNLTKDREKLIDVVADKWLNKFYSCEPLNEEKAKEYVNFVYERSKLEPPEIIFAKSPLHAWEIVKNLEPALCSISINVSINVSIKVLNNVRNKIFDKIWTKISRKVSKKVCKQPNFYFLYPHFGLVNHSYRAALYDFFDQIGVIDDPNFRKYRDLLFESNIYELFCYKNQALVVPLPLEIHVDENGDLHNENGPAVKWDGLEFFSLYGTTFQNELLFEIVTNKDPKQILGLENIEQRLAAIKTIGLENLLSELEYETIDSQRGYELMAVKNLVPEKEVHFLKYACPSTNQVHLSAVAPEVAKKKDAVLAVAAKWSLSKEQFLQIPLENQA